MSLLTVQSVRARAVRAPLAQPITTARLAIPDAPLVLVDVETREGVVGRAYLFAYTPMALRPLAACVTALGETLVGAEAAPMARTRDLNTRLQLLGRHGLMGMAIAGLDMALWDAVGEAREAPVVSLLGGEPAPIECYASLGVMTDTTAFAQVEAALAQGFKAVKIKIGGETVDADIAIVRRVREMVGPTTRLMVDYNQSLTGPEALRRLRALAPFDLHWVEEPLDAEDVLGQARLRAASTVPIQLGENWHSASEAASAMAQHVSDHAMLDVVKIGGVTGWVTAAGMASAASLPVSSHLFIEASAHVLGVTPTCHLLEHLDVASAILETPAQVQAGRLTPRGPGLGIRWNEAAIARYAA